MNTAIHFPNLGIHLEHVGKKVSVFGFDIAFYGIIIGIGILAGILIAAAEAKRTRQNPEDYFDLAIVAVIFSIIGARIYYVIFSWDYYKENLLRVFNIREGGLAIYGGVIAAVITVFAFAKIRKLNPFQILDTAVLGLVTGQMIGRWGNFCNREAFGEYTDSLFAMQLPMDAVRASDITDKMKNHIVKIDGTSFIQVHPTFLYESLWCLGVLIFLLLFRQYKSFQGEVFLLYLMGYGIGRFWIEGLRTDQLWIQGTTIPVSQVLAGVLAAVSFVIILCKRLRRNKGRWRSTIGKKKRKRLFK